MSPTLGNCKVILRTLSSNIAPLVRKSDFIKMGPIKIHPREASSLWLSGFSPSDFADRELSECQKQSISHFEGLIVNKFMKIHHGNTSLYCPKCNCFMGHYYFYNSPKKFHSNHSNPLRLQNAMMVHHVKYCHNHTSLWFFRRGKKQYHSFTGHSRTLIHQQLELAGAARGLPGDHGPPKRVFFSYPYNCLPKCQTSGHERWRRGTVRTKVVDRNKEPTSSTCQI